MADGLVAQPLLGAIVDYAWCFAGEFITSSLSLRSGLLHHVAHGSARRFMFYLAVLAVRLVTFFFVLSLVLLACG